MTATNKYKICTSFNAKMFNKFAHKTVGTILENYQEDLQQEVYLWLDEREDAEVLKSLELTENFKIIALADNGHYVDFQRKYDGGVPFRDRNIDPKKIDPGHYFRFNYMPFAKKVYSWVSTFMNMEDGEVLVWVDADIAMFKKMTPDIFDKLLPENVDICFLDRDHPWYAAETGYFMIRKTRDTYNYVSLILQMYASGYIFDLREWTDGFAFKSALKLVSDIPILNLNPSVKERDVFERTVLADFMVHYKGGKKNSLREEQVDNKGQAADTVIEFDPEDQ